ncbi:retrovirus-related pol polyprotein from transposon TNT 1-94 [Tanacetum coccineum]
MAHQLCDANFKVLFTKTQETIFNQNNKVVLIALRRRDVYVIDMSSYNEESNACLFSKASNSVNWLWHKRISNINKLTRQNLVVGLPSLTFSKDKTCSACKKWKHHRASFKTKRSFSISKCLHLLHMDLFGLVKPQTICHNKYTLVIEDEYSRSIIVKRHRKTTYDVFRGRSPDISYFHVFGCLVHIYNYRDHLGKFDTTTNDGFFLGYSPMAKAFRVFNIRRQEIEETYHVTFSEDDEEISKSNVEAHDPLSTNNISILDNVTPSETPILQDSNPSNEHPEFTLADDHPILNKHDNSESVEDFGITKDQVSTIIELVSNVKPSPTIISPSAKVFINPHVLQDRWSREKHIELVNILGEPHVEVTTRSKIRDSKAASTYECLYVNFLYEIEPNKLIKAPETDGCIIEMQEELNQFKRNKIWTLNKAKLVAQGYNQQERIDYDETFSPVARLEAIRIFLVYATYMGFVVFQMDVKSAFLNGKISKKLYVQQPSGFESSEFPNHVCKIDKALYGLKQAPRAWYETLSKLLLQHKFVRDLLKKYDLADSASVKCPMLPPNNLGPDESEVSINETLFRGMTWSLMYLTASRPDTQFSTCLYAKRIFRYLKRTLNLGHWYSKGSSFDLKAYSDSDYTGCNLDRKSTSGGCQIFCGKLVCKSAMKQSSVAMSSAEAKYVVAAGCYAQVL